MQFVLRLRYDIHLELDKISVDIGQFSQFEFKSIQAYSTYLHETIHWWQHIGSTIGFILSLSHPSQAHINIKALKEYTNYTGCMKPIKKYNAKYAKTNTPTDNEFRTINTIINNFHDIEYFKNIVISPRSVQEHVKEDLFESVGHSYHIAYSSFCHLLASCFDMKYNFIPNANLWLDEFTRLRENKCEGYYYGSPIGIPLIGVHDLFEGQARFCQLHYLHYAAGGNIDWDDFDKAGLLSGVYYSSFELFLELIGEDRPNSISSPLVALYLLVIDLSINPTDGFPFDIIQFETFIESVDPGIRFTYICNKIKSEHPEVKTKINKYSKEEFFEITDLLANAILCISPSAALKTISKWVDEEESIQQLMTEENSFNFSDENLPIRLLFSRFIRFQLDKLSTPEFFCWPGYHMTMNANEETLSKFKEHQALFADNKDGNIYPRTFEDKEEKNVVETFNKFYAWVSGYDLTRQWIVNDGDFTYDFFWLTDKLSMDEFEEWADANFKQVYGVSTKDFQIL